MSSKFKFSTTRRPIPGTNLKWYKADGFLLWHHAVDIFDGETISDILPREYALVSDIMDRELPGVEFRLHASIRWVAARAIELGVTPYHPYISVYVEDQENLFLMKLKGPDMWPVKYGY